MREVEIIDISLKDTIKVNDDRSDIAFTTHLSTLEMMVSDKYTPIEHKVYDIVELNYSEGGRRFVAFCNEDVRRIPVLNAVFSKIESEKKKLMREKQDLLSSLFDTTRDCNELLAIKKSRGYRFFRALGVI